MASLEESKPFPLKLVLIAGITLVVAGLIVYLVGKFGSSKEDQKKARELGSDVALSDNVVNAINKQDSKFREPLKDAVLKKYGNKATAKDVENFVSVDLLPNKKQYGDMVKQILSAYTRVGSNDYGKIIDVIKRLKSQFEINAFATDYAVLTKQKSMKPFIPAGKSILVGDFYTAIDDLMKDSKEADLKDMIDAKPLI